MRKRDSTIPSSPHSRSFPFRTLKTQNPHSHCSPLTSISSSTLAPLSIAKLHHTTCSQAAPNVRHCAFCSPLSATFCCSVCARVHHQLCHHDSSPCSPDHQPRLTFGHICPHSEKHICSVFWALGFHSILCRGGI